MNTQTHLAVAAALLTRPMHPRENFAVVAGAILPDMSIYVLFIWAKLIAGIPDGTLWRVTYWQEPWQTLSAVSNSVPLYAALLIVGILLHRPVVWLFAAAALVHMSLDFPFHGSDAHVHFWPISNWRFHSPLSYWEPGRYSEIVALVEIGIGIAALTTIWRRFRSVWVRALAVLGLVGYVAVPVYFAMTLG